MMTSKHDYLLVRIVVLVGVVLLGLVSSIPASCNSIVWQPSSSSWKKKPTYAINRLQSSSSSIQVDELLLRGGGADAPVPITEDDESEPQEEVEERAVAIPSQVSPLAFIKHFSVWYYQACQRAITTAVAEFKRPVTSGAGQSNLLVCCLVRTKRVVVGSTVAFWKTENRSQVGGEAKQVASQLLSWSAGKLKKVREMRREALSSEESTSEDDEDDSTMEKDADAMSMEEEEVGVAPLETTTSSESEEGIMPPNNDSPTTTARSNEASTSDEVQSTATSTTATATTIAVPPPKNWKSKVVRIAAIVNRISSYCIVIAFLGIAVRELTTDGGVDISKLLPKDLTTKISKLLSHLTTKIKTVLSWIQSKIRTTGGEETKPKQK